MNDIDIGRARSLAAEISANLSSLPAQSGRRAELRAEVDALQALLDRPDAQPAAVAGKLKSVHGMFGRAVDELHADGIRAGEFLSEIGRMLGLD